MISGGGSNPVRSTGASSAYTAIRGVNPPPHVAVRRQTHPHEFPLKDPDFSGVTSSNYQLPLFTRQSTKHSRDVPTISAGWFVRGVSTLFGHVKDSFQLEAPAIIAAIAGWWDAPVEVMMAQFADDVFRRQVYAIAPEVGVLVWEMGDSDVTCALIIEAVTNMLSRVRAVWRGRWIDLFSYRERIEMVATQLGVSAELLFSLLEDADVLAALNGEHGETSFVGDFIGYPASLSNARAPEIDQPERFMSLADSAIKSGLRSFHDVMLYVGSQGAIHASAHPYPVTHASIQYRLWYDRYLWETNVGKLLGSPSLPYNFHSVTSG